MGGNLLALNRAFNKAFMHTATEETLLGFLEHLGEELTCDRISIFEIHDENVVDNTYEWCRPGVLSEINLLQHLTFISTSNWGRRFMEDEIVSIACMESLKEEDPGIYELFCSQGVNSVLTFQLAFHGKLFGFCVLENPSPETLENKEELMPGMRYILSSLLYSDHLLHRFHKLGYSDVLTGVGNRLYLQEHLEQLDPSQSVGMIYCVAFAWKEEDGRPEHLEERQMIIHAGSVLQNLFDEGTIFRVGTTEFLVVCSPIARREFEETIGILRRLFLGQDLVVAIGMVWEEQCDGNYDALIRRANLLMFNEKRELVQQRKQLHLEQPEEKPHSFEGQADIRLPRSDRFFIQADRWLSQIFDENTVTIVSDINYFKLYNDIFGRRAGDLFLESVADTMQSMAQKLGGIAGYLGGDNFCLMFPTKESEPEALRPLLEHILEELEYADGFSPAFGIYLSADRQETCIISYDHALMALAEIKGSYTEHIRFYDRGQFENMRNRKILLMDARTGMERKEFFFYVQPQVNEGTGKIIGAEALVRWLYQGQICKPPSFIDIMEKSGYIYILDCYVWEQVCIWLRSLLDRGIEPVPVSVNVSRVDFYFGDVAERFISLVRKYHLDTSLLGVEITETAFTENLDNIHKAIQKLHDAGFRILMDDFGSGSSSLSMLHQMNVDVLKTDVHFMSQKRMDSKAISIVESVISMAHMMGMMVIAEGVETPQQRDKLVSLGDNYAQGFYFYKPMPVGEFEELLQDRSLIGDPIRAGHPLMKNRLHFRDMLHEGMLSETLLDNIIGPAAVIRKDREKISLVQFNDMFAQQTGIEGEETARMKQVENLLRCLEEQLIRIVPDGALEHPLEGIGGLIRMNIGEEERSLRTRLFLLYEYDGHMLYMITLQ